MPHYLVLSLRDHLRALGVPRVDPGELHPEGLAYKWRDDVARPLIVSFRKGDHRLAIAVDEEGRLAQVQTFPEVDGVSVASPEVDGVSVASPEVDGVSVASPEFQLLADFVLALNLDRTALLLAPAMKAIARYKDALAKGTGNVR